MLHIEQLAHNKNSPCIMEQYEWWRFAEKRPGLCDESVLSRPKLKDGN